VAVTHRREAKLHDRAAARQREAAELHRLHLEHLQHLQTAQRSRV
jgi:hypothetical protein